RTAINSVLDLKPVWYRSKCESDNPDHSHYGFISEDVAEVDPRFVNYAEAEDGSLEPGDVNYGAITALLVSVVKEQRGQIAELTARLDKIEA
ncbi:MAG: tail fiber domain-containing protein, partial [Ilumatobacter sp.]|nr:tail fiber domain-containing protein [Ilumatobacter sp.]